MRARPVASLLLAAAVLSGVLAASTLAAPTGKLIVSGALHGAYSLSGKDSCIVRTAPGFAIIVAFAPSNHGLYGLPEVAIMRVAAGSPGSVELSTTRSFDVTFSDTSPNDSWLAGWTSENGTTTAHFGSGVLSMSASGRSGTLDAELSYDAFDKATRVPPVHLTLTWNCGA